MRSTTIAAGSLALALASSCGLGPREIEFVERADLAIEVPAARVSSDAPRAEAHELVTRTADAIDGWIGPIVDEVAIVIETLEEHRETRRAGATRIYGPFDDPAGRELAWVVELAEQEHETSFAIRLGPPGADEDATELAVHGRIDREDDRRVGEITIDLDAIDRHRALLGDDVSATLTGAVTIAFTRAADEGSARVAIDFEQFLRADEAGATWTSDETFVLERDEHNGGAFHLVLTGTVDVPALGELDVDRLELDVRWEPGRAGRTRARLVAAENPKSALPHGDVHVDECFDSSGGLTFRGLNEPYAAERPEYGFGDAASCVFADADLDPP